MSRHGFVSTVAPLIHQIETYDSARSTLENREVTPTMMVSMTEILKHQFVVEGHYREHKVALIDQVSIRGLLRDLGDYECRLEIRTPPRACRCITCPESGPIIAPCTAWCSKTCIEVRGIPSETSVS